MLVVTFNVQHGLRPDGVVDIDALARWCGQLGADVLALQEVDVAMARSSRVDTVAQIAARTGMTGVFGPALTDDGAKYGNALLVRGTVGATDVFPLPAIEGDEARVLLVAEVRVGADPLTVAVTHVSTRHPRAQLGEVCALIATRSGPMVLAGDFNATTGTVAEAVGSQGFELGAGDAPTYPARAPRVRLDHIAVRDLVCEQTVVLPAAPVSDHLALAARVFSA